MAMKIFVNVLASVLAVLGYFLTYILNRKKLRGYKRLLLFCVGAITVTLIWVQYCSQEKESASKSQEYTSIKTQLAEIRQQNDTLKLQVKETVEGNRKLLGDFKPLMQIWQTEYPKLTPKEAFAAIAHDLQGKYETAKSIQTLLLFMSDKTKVQKATDTGLIHTYYFFRSRYTMPLRDISINLRFDTPFISVNARIVGAVVFEQGSNLSKSTDSSALTYSTGYLSESNDIVIEVVSRKPISIVSNQLSP
jgi:hypothetical protein